VSGAHQLFRHLFGGQRGFLVIVSAERTDEGEWKRGGTEHTYFNFPGQLQEACNHALAESQRGREAYFCAHLLTDKRRVKENAADVVTLWGESDGGELPNGNKKPTAAVESSPGKFHIYYRLTDPIPPQTAERLNRRLAHDIGADPSGFDLSQLLRVPGTVNHKYPERPEVRVVDLDGSRAYTPAELDEILAPPSENGNGHTPRAAAGEPPVRLSEATRRIFEGQDPKTTTEGTVDRSATLMKIARVLYDAGANRTVIVAALAERDRALGFNKYTGRADAEQRYHEIVDELEASGRNQRINITIGQGDANEAPREYTHSDLGNAERFVDRHGHRVRWCPARKMYLFWDGKRWTWDERGEVTKLAHETARSIFADAEHATDQQTQRQIAKFAVASQNQNRISGMLSEARPYLAVGMDELDRDPWLITCENGTLDLRTRKLKDHDPEDHITKLAPVSYRPEAACPVFEKYLRDTLEDAVISFVKRYAGYTLTGITRERLFAILWGSGKNGKTTLVELLEDVMGDYATNTDTETILAKKYQGVGNDVAALRGARFVAAAEVEQGRRLAESKVKQLTGSDTITARHLFGEPFDFRPQFKLWLSTNNKPVIQGTDDAIWDRIRLIPFTQRFEGARQDPKLAEKLRGELPGVFAWMVSGCLEWQEHGLGEPESVLDATKHYRSEMDTLAAFIDEKCVVAPNAIVSAEILYQQYSLWCDNYGERKDSQKALAPKLRDRGFERQRATGGVNRGRYVWLGIGLRNDGNTPDDADEGSRGGDDNEKSSHREYGLSTPEKRGAVGGRESCSLKNHILKEQNSREEENTEEGSHGSHGSPSTHNTGAPVSFSARPEDGAVPLEDLKHRERIAGELKRKGSGARINLAHYLRSDTTLEILTRSVLVGLGKDAGSWQSYAPIVEEAAKDPQNHPLDCECGGCL
jgi:P4 family phage/plasmid primase-like protien